MLPSHIRWSDLSPSSAPDSALSNAHPGRQGVMAQVVGIHAIDMGDPD